MRGLLFVVAIIGALSPGLAAAQQMKPGKGGAGGSGVLSNGGSRTPSDNAVAKGDGPRANNKQGGQQQQQPKGGNQ
jgi:hypothetical protein